MIFFKLSNLHNTQITQEKHHFCQNLLYKFNNKTATLFPFYPLSQSYCVNKTKNQSKVLFNMIKNQETMPY